MILCITRSSKKYLGDNIIMSCCYHATVSKYLGLERSDVGQYQMWLELWLAMSKLKAPCVCQEKLRKIPRVSSPSDQSASPICRQHLNHISTGMHPIGRSHLLVRTSRILRRNQDAFPNPFLLAACTLKMPRRGSGFRSSTLIPNHPLPQFPDPSETDKRTP